MDEINGFLILLEKYVYSNNSLLIDYFNNDRLTIFIDSYEQNQTDNPIHHLLYAEYLIINNIDIDIGLNMIDSLIKKKCQMAIRTKYLICEKINKKKALKLLKKYKNKYVEIDKIYAFKYKKINIFRKYKYDIYCLFEICKYYVEKKNDKKIDKYFEKVKSHQDFKYLLYDEKFCDLIYNNFDKNISFSYFNIFNKIEIGKYYLAKHYIYGYGTKKNTEKAKKLLIECNNYIPALIELGNLYESGKLHSNKNHFLIILEELIKNYSIENKIIISKNLLKFNGNNKEYLLNNIIKTIDLNIDEKNHLRIILNSLIELYGIDYFSVFACYFNVSEKDFSRIFHMALDKIGLKCGC